MAARIAAMEAELAERTASERLSHEIADKERERREAAEALLRGLLETWPHLTPIADHFARYKD